MTTWNQFSPVSMSSPLKDYPQFDRCLHRKGGDIQLYSTLHCFTNMLASYLWMQILSRRACYALLDSYRLDISEVNEYPAASWGVFSLDFDKDSRLNLTSCFNKVLLKLNYARKCFLRDKPSVCYFVSA